jgi:hypothetical protein
MRALFAVVAALLAATPALAGAPGAWQISDQVSALDGKHTFAATLASTNTLTNFSGAPEAATLRVRCDHGDLAVDVLWPDFTSASRDLGDHSSILWRTDAGKVATAEMQRDVTSLTAFDADARQLLARWRGAAALIVRAPDQHGDQDATFDLSGLAQALAGAAEAGCPTAG